MIGAVDQMFGLDKCEKMKLFEAKFKRQFKDWALIPMCLLATETESYKSSLVSIKDRIVGHPYPVVVMAFFPQEHCDTEFSKFMVSFLDIAKPMVRICILPAALGRIS